MMDGHVNMEHAAPKPGLNPKASNCDSLLRRVVLPAVVLIGLYGLIRYGMGGKKEDTRPGYPAEQKLSPKV